MNFNDKVVLITGGSSGIGAAIAIKFAEHGAKVAIVGRNQTKLKIVSEKCEHKGNHPLVILADITKDSDAKKTVSDVIAHFRKIDILVNNAGIGGHTNILENGAMELYDRIMAVNLRAAVNIIHIIAPHLIETKGNIINISSVASSSVIAKGNFAYCTSKAALDHFSRCIALEMAPKGVRVNVINPGPVRTDFIDNMLVSEPYNYDVWDRLENECPLMRIGEAEEIADLAMFLASEKARSITGSAYVSDNGLLLRGTME